jgi:REP element-mobilizing transposase RayT
MTEQNNLSPGPNRRASQHIKPVRSGTPSPLHPGVIYHIYNRGVNGEAIFKEKRNYEYFINLYVKHIQPVADTYAFCLLPNHFHILAEVKDLSGLKSASQSFSNFFNAYAKSINKAYGRTGPLFERPFKRIPVTDSDYFTCLLIYIHQHPQRHGLIEDYRDWPYSSYGIFTSDQASFVKRDAVSEWFGDVGELLNAHRIILNIDEVKDFVDDE